MNTSAAERSQAFATNGAARLKLSNIRGRVDIQPGAAGAITVTAVQHDPGRGTQVELTQAPDDTVSAVTRFTPSLLGWLGALGGQRAARVDYTVRVPHACSVELSIVEGQALVRGLSGDFELRTVSGRLHWPTSAAACACTPSAATCWARACARPAPPT